MCMNNEGNENETSEPGHEKFLRAKHRNMVNGKFLGRRKITFDRGPLTVVGDAYQDENFITVVTNKGIVRIGLNQVLFDDYGE